jgi:hypothetical protein
MIWPLGSILRFSFFILVLGIIYTIEALKKQGLSQENLNLFFSEIACSVFKYV